MCVFPFCHLCLEQGATASDNVDDDLTLTAMIVTTVIGNSFPIDTSILGLATILYDVTGKESALLCVSWERKQVKHDKKKLNE